MKIWTEPELYAMKQRYPIESTAVLAVDFGTDAGAVRHKAFTMGLKKVEAQDGQKYRNRKARNWTESEDDLIREWWPVISNREQRGKNSDWLARKLGVSPVQVRSRASALGMRVLRQKEPPWSDEEIELLDQWLHLTPVNIRTRLARRGFHRSEAAITVQRFRKLGGLANATGG